jgi:hypothetical protein
MFGNAVMTNFGHRSAAFQLQTLVHFELGNLTHDTQYRCSLR